MYILTTTRRFEKSLKLCKKRNYDLSLLQTVLDLLQNTGKLPAKYKSHKLSGDFKDCWECHIKPDWLLVWKQNDTELVLLLLDTGTHSDLF
ncbi:mRNA interferase YafQ [Flavobacterium arsenatis]|uniref:mRNA interferase YafQ n=1 Tax=Flavobacterium arsenatis TaxID=1484332 RepID=A0ABU1TTX5_9FLAO|nr:type II toxin-antitoxin system YafQ family toxin [Flavobacterium arsenatis]MDR6969330.1 mRNA interferase YafQ [Flavobacterium arsenatis]